MNNNKVSYEEVARVKMTESRDVVISKCSRGGYTIAQKVIIDNDEKPVSIFLKGAIKVNDIESLISIKEMLEMSIDKLENESSRKKIEWDED